MTEEEIIEEANVVLRKIEASIAEIVASEQKKDGVLCLAFAEVAKTLLRLCLSSLDEDGHEAFLSLILESVAPEFTLTERERH